MPEPTHPPIAAEGPVESVCQGEREWPEWGNPIEGASAYSTIRAYSPYDNVRAQAYPHLLVTAGVSDLRVTYWEPGKWVARLRALKTDHNRLLLRTNMSAGHGGALRLP